MISVPDSGLVASLVTGPVRAAVLVVGLTGLIPMRCATLAVCSCAWSPFESRTGHSHATNSPGESRGMSERMYRTRARDDALSDVKLQARVVLSIPTTQLVPLALNIISDIDNTEITYGLMQSVNTINHCSITEKVCE